MAQRYTPSLSEISEVVSKSLKQGLLSRGIDTAAVYYDYDLLEQRGNSILSAFPADSIHTAAVKANPLNSVLVKLFQLGFGFECAGAGEISIAMKAGAGGEQIVFDSPAKTLSELEFALQGGIYINADSFPELQRIRKLHRLTNSKSNIGIRVNPQIGTGSIVSTGVSATDSKFGIPLNANRRELMDFYAGNAWLNGIHVHIGSQGYPVPMLVDGIKRVMDFTMEINRQTQDQIRFFDLGGGLPVRYRDSDDFVSMEEYSLILREQIPELFTGKYRLITEFGRYLHANAGWVVSVVEYVKKGSGKDILIHHVGADMFLRKSYNPNDWHHNISVLDSTACIKSDGNLRKYMVAGPLCFSGDILEREIELPEVEEGDYLVIHDAGAYILSMWSRYNSRQIPKVMGYSKQSERIEIIKQREELSSLLRFWE